MAPPEPEQRFTPGVPSASVQMLQKIMAPRPLAPFTDVAALPLPTQRRSASTESLAGNSSQSGYCPCANPEPLPGSFPMEMVGGPPDRDLYLPGVFPEGTTLPTPAFPVQTAFQVLASHQHQNYTTEALPVYTNPTVGYGVPIYSFNNQGNPRSGPMTIPEQYNHGLESGYVKQEGE